MTFTLALPDCFEFVVLAAVSSTFMTTWQGFQVSAARKKSGIKYPQMYAEKAEIAANKEALTFNNVQRAHQNTLESHPTFLTCLLVTGLEHPTIASALGGAWIVGRILYTIGYRNGAEKRFSRGGGLGLLAGTALQLGAAWVSFGFIRKSLGF